MKPRRKFPFTGHIVTRTGKVRAMQFTHTSGWGAYEIGNRHYGWPEIHATVADAVAAGRKLIADAEEKIERLQALQDARRINLDKAQQKGPAS